jgi:hypothetical protein
MEKKEDLIERLNRLAAISLKKGCICRCDYNILIESWQNMTAKELKGQLKAFYMFKILWK